MGSVQDVIDFLSARVGNPGDEAWDYFNNATGAGWGHGWAWCAAEASMAQREAGSGGGSYASCPVWWNALSATGQTTQGSGLSGIQPGDLIFFGSYASDHVATIISVGDQGVYHIDGNWADQVSVVFTYYGDNWIWGYATPAYSDNQAPPEQPSVPQTPAAPTITEEEQEMADYNYIGNDGTTQWLVSGTTKTRIRSIDALNHLKSPDANAQGVAVKGWEDKGLVDAYVLDALTTVIDNEFIAVQPVTNKYYLFTPTEADYIENPAQLTSLQRANYPTRDWDQGMFEQRTAK